MGVRLDGWERTVEIRGMYCRILYLAIALCCLAACATSHVMIGKARPAISPESVQVYMRPPDMPYEEIARIETSSQGAFAFGAQAKTDAVIHRLKVEAAKLGANGVLLEGMGDQPSGSVGTGRRVYVVFGAQCRRWGDWDQCGDESEGWGRAGYLRRAAVVGRLRRTLRQVNVRAITLPETGTVIS